MKALPQAAPGQPAATPSEFSPPVTDPAPAAEEPQTRVGVSRREEMLRELRWRGVALLGWGALSLVLNGVFDPVWGVVLILGGAATLLIRRPESFIGSALTFSAAGALNILAGASSKGLSLWLALGILQLWWAVQDMRAFLKYRAPPKQ